MPVASCVKWKETGAIAAFELGQRDLSDRFLIPEKLYGREAEVQQLLEAFDRVASGNSGLTLVAGLSGIGKTAVVTKCIHQSCVNAATSLKASSISSIATFLRRKWGLSLPGLSSSLKLQERSKQSELPQEEIKTAPEQQEVSAQPEAEETMQSTADTDTHIQESPLEQKIDRLVSVMETFVLTQLNQTQQHSDRKSSTPT